MGYIEQEMPSKDFTTLSWTSVNKYLQTVSTVQLPLPNSNKQLTAVRMSLEYGSEWQTLGHAPYNLAVHLAFNSLCGESDRNQKLSVHKLPVTCTGTIPNSMHSQCSLLSCKWRTEPDRGKMCKWSMPRILSPKCYIILIFMTFQALHKVTICCISSTLL
jgi:hypothetical protein